MKVRLNWLKPSDSPDAYIRADDLVKMMLQIMADEYYKTITAYDLAKILSEKFENVPKEVL